MVVIRFPFYALSIYTAVRRNVAPVYNESHLYTLNSVYNTTIVYAGNAMHLCIWELPL
jgi:hypothetical protein